MVVHKGNNDVSDRLCSILENLEGTPMDQLQGILRNLNSNVDTEEERFMSQLLKARECLAHSTEGRQVESKTVSLEEGSPLRGLVSEARKHGLTTEDLAERAKLSVPLVLKLDLRQIEYISIPRQIVEDIAGALKRSVEQIAVYLQGDPIRTAVFQSHSLESNEAPHKEDFTEAVQSDSSLTPGARNKLLRMRISK